MHTPCLTNQSYFLYSVDVLRALACRFIPHTWAGISESWEGRLNIFTIRWLYSPVAVYSIKERGVEESNRLDYNSSARVQLKVPRLCSSVCICTFKIVGLIPVTDREASPIMARIWYRRSGVSADIVPYPRYSLYCCIPRVYATEMLNGGPPVGRWSPPTMLPAWFWHAGSHEIFTEHFTKPYETAFLEQPVAHSSGST